MKKHYLTALLIIYGTLLSISQNLVADSSFESIETFEDKTLNWYWLRGTADLFDTSGRRLSEHYMNFEKAPQAVTGRRYIGMIQPLENLSGRLIKPLEKDKIYEVSVYTKLPDANPISYNATLLKEFPVIFSVNDSNWMHQPLVTLTTTDNSVVTTKWTLVTARYKAKGGENRITIGGCTANYCNAYYLYDYISVKLLEKNAPLLTTHVQEEKKIEDPSIIYFDTDKDVIKESEKEKIQRNVKILNENKNLAITIGGFTDSDGKDAYNVKLGARRAKNVKEFLIQNGYADSSNINIKSFGKSPTSNAESKAKSRRVELFFTPQLWNQNQKEAIVVVTKLYGYVRWFYPTDVLDKLNWDKFLNKTIIEISSLKEKAALRQYIIGRFTSIAPELRFFNDMNSCLNYKKTLKINKTLVFKKKVNEGMGQAGNNVYDMQLVDCKATAESFNATYKGKNYTFKDAEVMDTLPLSIAVYMPLVLSTQKYSIDKIIADSLTHTMSDTISKYNWMVSGIMVWNAVQHFYPYLDVLNIKWSPKIYDLVESLDKTTSDSAFETIMNKLTVQLNDGHTGFYNKSIMSDMWLPFELANINNKLVVSRSFDSKAKAGDELIKMDGMNCMEIFKRDTAFVSGTKNRKIASILKSLTATNKYGTFSHLVLKREGKLIEVDMKRDWLDDTIPPIQYLPNGLIYINCGYLEWKNIDSILPKINASKGVIFDLREYLSDDSLINILKHLLQTSDTVNNWMQTPIYLMPNQKNVVFNKEGWALESRKPYISCPVAFLANGASISYNESILGLIKHYKLGKIIGEKTAGSNGSRNMIELPKGYLFNWTGMYVTLPDGSPLQGIGIEPDILASPNPQLATYEDYILKTAIRHLINK